MKDDEPPEDVSKSELWNRLRRLEKAVYPDRRDILKAGTGAAVGGAAVFGAIGGASAGSQSSGTVGTQDKPQDAYLEDVYDYNGNQSLSLPGDGSVSIDKGVIAQELGLPEYDDVSNAPQTQGRLVYATGVGASAEGIYKHDGTSYGQVGAKFVDDETAIEASRGANASGVTSQTWTNIVDTEDQDNLGEFNTSQQFVPNETGYYTVITSASISPGASGDLLQMRLQDVTNTAEIAMLDETQSQGSDRDTLTRVWYGELTSGVSYEVQARDFSSSYDLRASTTELDIVRGLVHPN